MRIAVYARVSTPRQAQSQSIDQQLDSLLAHVEAQELEVAKENIFRDDGLSGATLGRPGLSRLRQQAACGQIDRVIMTSPDRLARNYVHQVLLLEEFNGYNCEVEFLDRPWSHDPQEQLLLQIRGAVAEYERTLIAERMRRGRQMKLKAGLMLPFSKPPYGYLLDPAKPRSPEGMRQNEAEAAIVAEIFALYQKEGVTLVDVAKHLVTQGIPTPSGKRLWQTPSVRAILTNPVYTGTVFAGRKRVREATRRRSALKPVGRKNETRQLRPREEWIEVAKVEAIIRQEDFDRVQAKLANNKRLAKRNNKRHGYLLRGLLSCGKCRLSCGSRTEGESYGYYFCRGKADPVLNGLERRCQSRVIRVDELDEMVWQDLCAMIEEPQQIISALMRAEQGEWMPQQMEARRRNIKKGQTSLKNQIERLSEAYLQGVIEIEEYKRRRKELEERVEGLRKQEEQLEEEAEREGELAAKIESLKEFCERIKEGLTGASFEQKRQLVELLIDRVVVTDEEVEIRYVMPTSPSSEHTRFCHLRKDYL